MNKYSRFLGNLEGTLNKKWKFPSHFSQSKLIDSTTNKTLIILSRVKASKLLPAASPAKSYGKIKSCTYMKYILWSEVTPTVGSVGSPINMM